MPIVQSTIIDSTPQAGGGVSVTERHIDHIGRVYDVAHILTGGEDPQQVMTVRAQKLGEMIDAALAVEAAAGAKEIPLEAQDIVRRFTSAEWLALKTLSETNGTAARVWSFFHVMGRAYRDDELLNGGLNALVSGGVLTSQRKAEILAL